MFPLFSMFAVIKKHFYPVFLFPSLFPSHTGLTCLHRVARARIATALRQSTILPHARYLSSLSSHSNYSYLWPTVSQSIFSFSPKSQTLSSALSTPPSISKALFPSLFLPYPLPEGCYPCVSISTGFVPSTSTSPKIIPSHTFFTKKNQPIAVLSNPKTQKAEAEGS